MAPQRLLALLYSYVGPINRIVFRPRALQLKGHFPLMYILHRVQSRAISGYAQQYEPTVKQTAAHPRALSWDQNMEVSGADFFWPLCLGSPTLS